MRRPRRRRYDRARIAAWSGFARIAAMSARDAGVEVGIFPLIADWGERPHQALAVETGSLRYAEAVKVVWHAGMFEHLEPVDAVPDVADDPDGPGDDLCSVCRAHGAMWRHTLSAADGAAPLAVAQHWQLCRMCHELAQAGDRAALARRMRADGVSVDAVRHIAEILVNGNR